MVILKTYLIRLITLLLALQILNLSVCGGEEDNAAPSQQNTLGEHNQIDCLAEFVSEIILDYKNAIPENGAHNNSGNHSLLLKHISLKLFASTHKICIIKPTNVSVIPVPLKEEYKYLFLDEVIPQPPKC